jgi:DNA ligase (NAD+)
MNEIIYLKIPTTCPICGHPTQIRLNNNTETVCCTNPECDGILLGKFVAFVSRDAMDIRGLSEKTLASLIKDGKLHRFKDLYDLKHQKAFLYKIPGMGIKKVDNLLKAIEDSRNTTLEKFIPALGIPNIGRSAARTISQHCENPDDFFKKWKAGYHWSKLEDIGEVMEKNLNSYAKSNWSDIMDLVSELTFRYEESGAGEPPVLETSLLGKTFVITGKLEKFNNRKELEEYIKDLGGRIASSVSKNTTALINNDINSGSSKNKKAKTLGIPIWTEEEFLKSVN